MNSTNKMHSVRPNQKIDGGPVDHIERAMVQHFLEDFPQCRTQDATTFYYTALGYFRARGLDENQASRLAKFLADVSSNRPII